MRLLTLLKICLRIGLRFSKIVSRFFLRTSIDAMAACVLVLSVFAGILILIEPARSLRFRRSVGVWKVVPYLCRLKAVHVLADALYRLTFTPSVAVILMIARVVIRLFFAPMLAFLTILTSPATARSVIFLVGIPTLLLSLGCVLLRQRFCARIVMVPGLVSFITWAITTCLICALRAKSPKLLMWAISDISIPIYLTLVAIVLSVTTVIQRLETATEDRGVRGPGKKSLCYDHVALNSLSLLGVVAAVWILKASDGTLAALRVLQDVRQMSMG